MKIHSPRSTLQESLISFLWTFFLSIHPRKCCETEVVPTYCIYIYSREEMPNERKLQPKHSQELLDLASKMRMNTDSRKTIFCTLMSSNDYLDAFEKLVKLSLKSPVK